MVWRETFPPANEFTLDAEVERERRLAAQARAGADWALTALVARYQPIVTRYLTRLCGDQGRARVLSERVFQRMERRLHGPHGADNLRLWLLRSSTEAGLEALRRPRSAPKPRLDVSRVAGLLPAEAGAQAQRTIEGSIKRIKRVVGTVSRQARPLVWQNTPAGAGPAAESSRPDLPDGSTRGPIDESLESTDPYEALRHRLVRLTLAELPYGDAQCLALHLVAGLNQAEVARALGITNSAARRRIVQGLAQFSARYKEAMQKLGLPDALGYGDALPPVPMEEQALFSPPEMAAPVIVPEVPGELTEDFESLGQPQTAPTTIPLGFNPFGDEAEQPDAVAYFASSSPEIPAYPHNAEPESAPEPEAYFTLENQQVFAGSYDDAYTTPYAGPYAEPAPGYAGGSFEADAPSLDEPLPAYDQSAEGFDPMRDYSEFHGQETPLSDLSWGGHEGESWAITRIAADAIVGPVVDALPVTDGTTETGGTAGPSVFPPGYGAAAARSMPLTYELPSVGEESGSIIVNWLDSDEDEAGTFPLTFEADAAPDPGANVVEVAPGGQDDPWAASAILDLEASHPLEETSRQFAPVEQGATPDGGTAEADGASGGSPYLSIALEQPDYAWEHARPVLEPEQGVTAAPVKMWPLVSDASEVVIEQPGSEHADASHQATEGKENSGLRFSSSRTLEELWEDL
ncbi:MAG TPA: sigma factor-like helix-turn-helix DNA-binding protein [Ktedonobacterales bacterium]